MSDVVVVGSGINGLVAAALLSQRGWTVTVLERSDRAGGSIRTEVDTVFPGYTVELLSSWHPLFLGGPAYAALSEDLARLGVEYRNTTLPTGVACAAGTAVLSTDLDESIASLEALHPGDGESLRAVVDEFGSMADVAFGLLGVELLSRQGLRLLGQSVRRWTARGALAMAPQVLEPARGWLDGRFGSPVSRALLAPWALHNGLGPDDAGSAFITRAIAFALVTGGCPVPVGGGVRLVKALTELIREGGGDVITGADVTEISVAGKRATGVRTAEGEVHPARRAVLASVTPQALYGRLLKDEKVVPEDIRSQAAAFRYGRADMQMHLELSEPLQWRDRRLDEAAIVHVLPSVEESAASVAAANGGALPVRPTVVVGQPLTVDPGRAPEGAGLIWIQLQETPREPRTDAAGEIDGLDGTWTDAAAASYAERVLDQVRPHTLNLDSALRNRRIVTPTDLESMNCNLVGGDPYGGACTVDQFFLWRPLPSTRRHRTAVDGLYHIGASTHPGPGLGGGSGYLVAQELLGRGRRGRR